MEQFISVPLAVAVMENLLCFAQTAQHTPAVCFPIYTWDDPGALPSGGHIHLPVEHHEGQAMGLCTASWQLEFGWHVFCSLPCWDGGEAEGMDGPWPNGTHSLETPCPLPAPFPPILPPFPGATELVNCAGGLWGTRAAGWTPCPSVHHRLPCPTGRGRASASPTGGDAGDFASLSP